jgi:hypothetical protein
MNTNSTEDARDGLVDLAKFLGVGPEDLGRTIGHGWFVVRTPDHEDDLYLDIAEPWFVSGEPLQVMIRAGGPSVIVAVPAVRWDGPGTPQIVAEEAVAEFPTDGLDLDELAAAVWECSVRARRDFRWCHLCREVVGPWHLFDDSPMPVCQDCASRYHGVVY